MFKRVLITFSVIFAVCQAYAQTVDALLQASEAASETEFVPEVNIKVPIKGDSKFSRKFYTYQTLEFSTIAGKDKDQSDDEAVEKSQGISGIINDLNVGLNVGYSMIFVPGRVVDDQLELNRFGFAFSTGLLAAFDHQDEYDVTCDFLLKLGVETGNGHALGIGLDMLLGGGKSAGAMYDEEVSYPYTMWCWKRGAQMWLKTNLLTTGIKNMDILAFARFVYSQNPDKDEGVANPELMTLWLEESWQFGITLRYRF